MKPKFITFTGADDATDVVGMRELAKKYPIEWGVLFSPKRQGQGRYPSLNAIDNLTSAGLRLSAHLCGGDARAVIELDRSRFEPLLSAFFSRVQINTADSSVDPGKISAWANRLGLEPILQCREKFPDDVRVSWLFDASGGRGVKPDAWPHSYGASTLLGYAGGLNPGNVAQAVAEINSKAGSYWIDMETGVRDERDRFDLNKCRAVCEAVYGAAA